MSVNVNIDFVISTLTDNDGKINFRAAYAHVILGAHHLYNNQNQPNYQTMKTMKFINHPDYNSDQIANDVALVELPIEVEYNGKINI